MSSLTIIFLSTASAGEDATGTWFGTMIKRPLSKKYFLWAETQVRYVFDIGQTSQLIYRAGLLESLSSEHEIGYLYAHIQGTANVENRLTFQHTQQYGPRNGYHFSGRSRIEARFLENSHDDAARVRYNLRSMSSKNEGYRPVISNEIFINLTRDNWTGDRDIDRNRLFFGLNKKIHDFQIEFGYLNQFVPRKSKDMQDHVAVVNLFL